MPHMIFILNTVILVLKLINNEKSFLIALFLSLQTILQRHKNFILRLTPHQINLLILYVFIELSGSIQDNLGFSDKFTGN